MRDSQAKQQIFFRVISAPDPPPLRVLADAFGVDARTLRIWRQKRREAERAIRDDSAHLARVVDRA